MQVREARLHISCFTWHHDKSSNLLAISYHYNDKNSNHDFRVGLTSVQGKLELLDSSNSKS